MAENITAVFHYGEKNAETIKSTFSVVDYLSYIKDNSNLYDTELVDLASAMGDYGYYSQTFLNRVNKLNDMYEQMPSPDTSEYDFEELAGITDMYKVSMNTGNSAVDQASYSLLLDSSTALKIYFTTKSSFEGTPAVSVNGGEAIPAVKRGEKYVVTIDNLSAHKLADMNEIKIMADGECIIEGSALSYVNPVLSSSTEEDDAKNAMASLYQYYEKAMAYKAKG